VRAVGGRGVGEGVEVSAGSGVGGVAGEQDVNRKSNAKRRGSLRWNVRTGDLQGLTIRELYAIWMIGNLTLSLEKEDLHE
jgi:hypothetical protein